jgi:hypothetical protein
MRHPWAQRRSGGVAQQGVHDGRPRHARHALADAGQCEQRGARDLRGQRDPVPVREERILVPVDHQGRRGDLAEPLAPPRPAVDGPEHGAEVARTLRLRRASRSVEDRPGSRPYVLLIESSRSGLQPRELVI